MSNDITDKAYDIVGLIDDILQKAGQCSASDVHFEPGVSEMTIKFRLDGVLNPVEKLPGALAENVITRLKVMGNLLSYRNDVPQEGRIQLTEQQSGVIDQRLSVFPTIHGQRAVVRLFYNDAGLYALSEL